MAQGLESKPRPPFRRAISDLLNPTHVYEEDSKAGAPKKKKPKAELIELEGLVQPSQSRAPPGVIHPTHKLQGVRSLDQLAVDAVMSKLADSTRRVYASGWKQWELFNLGSHQPLFLDGEDRRSRSEDEQRLIRFVVFMRQIMQRSVGSIRQRFSAIRYAHISNGFPDPLVGRPRLWAAVAGFQRWEGAPLRKLPVTPDMLRWLLRRLKSSGYPAKDHAIIKAALLVGWFFMLRASELLPQADGED